MHAGGCGGGRAEYAGSAVLSADYVRSLLRLNPPQLGGLLMNQQFWFDADPIIRLIVATWCRPEHERLEADTARACSEQTNVSGYWCPVACRTPLIWGARESTLTFAHHASSAEVRVSVSSSAALPCVLHVSLSHWQLPVINNALWS